MIDAQSPRHLFLTLFVLQWLAAPGARAEVNPRHYAVEVSASVRADPPAITLTWPGDPRANSYFVYRLDPGTDAWPDGVTLPGTATSFTDSNVEPGRRYEYQIRKNAGGYTGYGYAWAGIEAPLIDQHGTLILIVERTHAEALKNELDRLKFDLVGDGWQVIRHDVSRDQSPAEVKALIQAEYHRDPARVRSVFLFGRVPVPYSGNFNPDGHPDHRGAWPADLYYGDIDGAWTDSTVSTRSAERARNHNVPGDGKFDQTELPSSVELEVGRVDLSNMTCFANKANSRDELALLRAYLDKDHLFRHGRIQVERRGLICDNFGEREGEAFAASGWRNFAPFFGASNVKEVGYMEYFPTVTRESYLWSYGTGGGSYYTCNGIGSSDDFAVNEIKTVFTMFLGSYFGDWDNESNFLRAPLGSSNYCLASAWAGRPHWFFHHMALGETIGYCTRLNQNNGHGGLYSAQNYGTRQVHVALMGDPTLRMHPVIPPSNLRVSLADGAKLEWSPSPDEAIQGYHVYRADQPKGPYSRLTGEQPLRQLSFHDPEGASAHQYMVRAVKLEQSASGTYFNPSQGIFCPSSGEAPNPNPPPPPAPPAQEPPPVVIDEPPLPGSSVPASAQFAGFDRETAGNWPNAYGSEGYWLAGEPSRFPVNSEVRFTNAGEFTWNDATIDDRALAKTAVSQYRAACWTDDNAVEFRLILAGASSQKLTLYCLDWDTHARRQTVELLDHATGALLDRRELEDFHGGAYLTWNVSGEIRVRISRQAGNNAVLMGIFLDPVGESSPPGTGGIDSSPSLQIARSSTGELRLHVQGQPGQVIRIEQSADFRNWTEFTSLTLAGEAITLGAPIALKQSRFFRIVQP